LARHDHLRPGPQGRLRSAVHTDIAEIGLRHEIGEQAGQAGGSERVRVVSGAVDRTRSHRDEIAVQSRGDLKVHAGEPDRRRVQVRDRLPVPRRTHGAVDQHRSPANDLLWSRCERPKDVADHGPQHVPPTADCGLAYPEHRTDEVLRRVLPHQTHHHRHRSEQPQRQGPPAGDELVAARRADAVARNGVIPNTIHADRGGSMTSKPVSELMIDLGVCRSHSRPQCSNGNPYSEAHFKTLKYMPDFPDRFGSLAAARAFCERFFTAYNHEHCHSGIGMHTRRSVEPGAVPSQTVADLLAIDELLDVDFMLGRSTLGRSHLVVLIIRQVIAVARVRPR
jgi:transposase InsO family protein